jgi:hypothetical protein
VTIARTARIDVNIPRVNQGAVATLTGAGFLTQIPALVVAAFALLVVTRLAGPARAPITQLYLRGIKPRLSAEPATEPAGPPRFSQLLGILFTGLSSAALLGGSTRIGWTVALLVFALATLASVGRICVGCILYRAVRGEQ